MKPFNIVICIALLCACLLFSGVSCGGRAGVSPHSPTPLTINPVSPKTGTPPILSERPAIQQIQILIQDGKYDKAVKKLNSKESKDFAAEDFEDLAKFFQDSGRKGEALKTIETAYNHFPDNQDTLRIYTNLLFDNGKAGKADKIIRQAMNRDKGSSGYYYMLLGELSILKRNKHEAALNLGKALELMREEEKSGNNSAAFIQAYAEAFTLYGSVMLKQKKYGEAKKSLENALQMCGMLKRSRRAGHAGDCCSAAYFQLARLNMVLNNLPAARDCVEEVGKYAPESMDYDIIRSEYFRASGDFKSAEKILLDMINNKPVMMDEASIRLSSVYCGMKNREAALKYFRLAMEKTGNRKKIISLMGENPYFEYIENDPAVKEAIKNHSP
jgi:tetratricopeptide (TPR) repeat protein